jgi:hypothetical protein
MSRSSGRFDNLYRIGPALEAGQQLPAPRVELRPIGVLDVAEATQL